MNSQGVRMGVLAAVAGGIALVLVLLFWQNGQTQRRVEQVARSHTQLCRAIADRQERITELPEDGSEFHVSLFLHDDWRARNQDRRLYAWFRTEPRLMSVWAQTHPHTFTESDPMYKSQYAKHVPVLPAVMVQYKDGKVLFKLSGENLPKTAGEMGDQVTGLFKNRPYYVFPWRRPKPCPQPTPTPAPKPDPSPPTPDVDVDVVIPDTVVPPDETKFPWPLTIVVCLLAAGGTILFHIRKEVRGV